MNEQKIDLMSLTYPELEKFITGLGEKSFRATQIFQWLYRGVDNFGQMTDINKELIEKLEKNAFLTQLKIIEEFVAKDGTTKFLIELYDGILIEMVIMQYKHGNSVCISSQAGCRMGCLFCASTQKGLQRNLTAGELLKQVVLANNKVKISNIVMMGVGEPLDNYENLLIFLDNIHHEKSLNISHRHISVSTCGLCDKIDDLAQKDLQITLSVSLHAPNDIIRNKIMPINNKYNIETLINTCKKYIEKTNRRISFEYILIKNLNDKPIHAVELSKLFKNILCHVNLIPVNHVDGKDLLPSDHHSILRFQKILTENGINTTVRRKLGSDIDASCGQLRLRYSEKQ